MRRFLRIRARRVPALLAALTLFLAGSNYCLLSAWAGNTHMACMTAPGSATASPPPCSHCAPASKASPASRQAPARSCCPDPVLVPDAPSLGKAVASQAAPAIAVLAAEVAPVVAPLVSEHSPPSSSLGPPQAGPACAPLAPRAP